jgi:hypothetical protein
MICSSVNRLGFMVHPPAGDGLYPLNRPPAPHKRVRRTRDQIAAEEVAKIARRATAA